MNNLNEYKKRFNTLMESTIGDVKPLIVEQNLEYWDKVPGGATKNSMKTVIKNFAANNPLIDATGGTDMGVGGGHKAGAILGVGVPKNGVYPKPLYIGAKLQATYNPLQKWPTVNAKFNGGKFGYEIRFYLTFTKGSTTFSENFDYFTIGCTGKGPKKFTIITEPTSLVLNNKFNEIFWKVRNSLATNLLLSNLDGWMGTLRGEINEELVKMGFNPIPNALQTVMNV
jgi:hypothetical protein